MQVSSWRILGVVLVAVPCLASYGQKNDAVTQAEKKDAVAGVPVPSIEETKAIAEQAYIYAFPMIAAYKAMYEFNVDKSSVSIPPHPTHQKDRT